MDPTKFLLSLAAAVAAICSADGGSEIQLGRDLWVGNSVASAGALRAVMAIYPGVAPDPLLAVEGLSIQVKASGKDLDGAMLLARRIYEALCDEDGISKTEWAIDAMKTSGLTTAADDTLPNGWTVLGMTFQQYPGTMGRDPASGEYQAGLNFDVRFCAND